MEQPSPYASTAEPSLSSPGAASPEPVRYSLRGTATEPCAATAGARAPGAHAPREEPPR